MTTSETRAPIRRACTRCGEEKLLTDFGKQKGGRYGRATQCRACQRERAQAWRRDNRQRDLERGRAYDESHREQRRTYRAAWGAANPHKVWESNYRQRVKALGMEGDVASFTREDVAAHWGTSCVYCDGPWEELEHLIPVVLGGRHALENCAPCCTRCNLAGAGALTVRLRRG